MNQQHILIVLNGDQFQGASITTDKGDPAPLDLDALSKLLPEINTAAITTNANIAAEKDAEIAALNDYIARVGQVKQAIFEVIQNPEIDALATTAAITTIIIEGEKPEADRIRAEKLAQLEALKAELGI